MFALLLTRITVRNPISTPITGIAHEQFIRYSSISQIHENGVVERSSSAIEGDTVTSVPKLLKSYDFTDPQIAKLMAKLPNNPSCIQTSVVRPKLDFLLDIGFSNAQLAKFVSANSRILESSLENRIKPNIALLESFNKAKKHLIRALIYSSSLLEHKLENSFFPNVRTLTYHGVPHNNILKFSIQFPRMLLQPAKKFEQMVQLVASKGLDPCTTLFCRGLYVLSSTSPSTWKERVGLYKSLGWSDENVASAFIRDPRCMHASEKKIKRVMNFFVNKRRCEPSYLAEYPVLFSLSLEMRIMPRCLVMDILMKKQLVKKKSFIKHFKISKKDFLEKYVICYQDQAPEAPTNDLFKFMLSVEKSAPFLNVRRP